MLHLIRRVHGSHDASDTLTLAYQFRQKSRLRVTLDSGREAGILIPRGEGALRDGELLQAEDGTLVCVRAAPETLSIVHCSDARTLARAAYHLGNRHVPLQVGDRWLAYLHDHVLDDMVRALGLTVGVEERPFEPESGAYPGGHAHDHGDHGHAHHHDHGHPHDDHGHHHGH
jgi:urease accessory protein